MSPGEFIPLAEETGQIVAIGSWVLHEPCLQAGRWQADYRTRPPLSISVNLSSRQLAQPGVVDEVAEQLLALLWVGGRSPADDPDDQHAGRIADQGAEPARALGQDSV